MKALLVLITGFVMIVLADLAGAEELATGAVLTDSYAGWFCYLTRNDLLFVKRFPTFPDRVYNEMAGFTVSMWYYKDMMCELEPIGPRTDLAPGKSASFTEQWWLLPHKFPRSGQNVDLKALSETISKLFAAEQSSNKRRSPSSDYRPQASMFDVTSKKKEDQVKVRIEDEKAVERSSAFWMDTKLLDAKGSPTKKIPLEGGYFEVTLPKALFDGLSEPLTVQWIDFYRG